MIGFYNYRCWKKSFVSTLLVFALVPLLFACGVERSTIADRVYTADTSDSPGLQGASQSVWKGMTLKVDRANKKVIFTFADKTKKELEYKVADSTAWPTGCPGNYSSVHLEALWLKQNLVIGEMTFKTPALVADCFYKGTNDPNPEYVRLVDGFKEQFACTKENACIKFRTKINCDPKKTTCP